MGGWGSFSDSRVLDFIRLTGLLLTQIPNEPPLTTLQTDSRLLTLRSIYTLYRRTIQGSPAGQKQTMSLIAVVIIGPSR